MFDKRFFAQMRRAGMSAGVSKSKLSKAMLEILVQLPEGTANLKDTVVHHLGLLGRMSATRDINAAWNEAKRKAARERPDRFVLGARGGLRWNDGSVKVLDKKITSANFAKLNELAESQNCSVDQLVSKLIRHFQKSSRG
jgi:hypothetical protein